MDRQAAGLSPSPSLEMEAIEAEILSHPQLEVHVEHRFAPGIYIREMFAPKGAIIIGHRHKTEHMNVALTGKALVVSAEGSFVIESPQWIVSQAGVRKLFYIIEDMRWATIHPTDETDVEKLEEQLVVKSGVFKEFMALKSELERKIKELGGEV